MKSLVSTPQISYTLSALSGPEKGVVYKLVAGRVTIGRGAQNDICIKDDSKMSRNHAVLTVSGQKIEITDVSDHNKIIVNGEEITSGEVGPGTTIQLGDTKFQLNIFVAKGLTPLTSLPPTGQTQNRRPRSVKKPGQLNFYILVGAIALLFIWLLTSKVKVTEPTPIRSENISQTEVDANRKIIEQVETERKRSGVDTRQYEEAQPNFVKGFRDYRKGQYERAIESYQACLSLFPEHIQCQRGLRLSLKKFSELVQYHIILANKYRAQNQFSACMSAYRNAMVMLKNTSDKIYMEAKAGYDVCQALQGDRY